MIDVGDVFGENSVENSDYYTNLILYFIKNWDMARRKFVVNIGGY
jgi:hypothetical protein